VQGECSTLPLTVRILTPEVARAPAWANAAVRAAGVGAGRGYWFCPAPVGSGCDRSTTQRAQQQLRS
jgi:hypothetical protein